MEKVFHRARRVAHDMAPRPSGTAFALVALLALVVGAVAVGAAAPPSSDVRQTDASDAQPSNTTMWVQLQANGDARWTVTMTVDLPDEQHRTAFGDVADRFESGQSDILSIDSFQQFADLSGQATGRDMRLVNVSRAVTVTETTGELSLSFTWTDFGRRENGRLYVGDAFDAPDGTWLAGLTADQRLVVGAPDSFSIAETPPGITIVNETIRWSGPTRFDPSYISITYSAETPTDTSPDGPSTVTSTRTTDNGTAATPDGTGELPLAGIGVFAFVAVVAVLYAVRTGRIAGNGDSPETDDDKPGSGSAPSDDGIESETEPAEDNADGTTGASDRTESGAESSPEGGTTPVPPAEPGDDESDNEERDDEAEDDHAPIDRELLSDEEYVEALIERNGGRMKQADIVTETGWSNAKVSQLLSAMAEDGRIEKLRIGRENLISFPEEDDR